MSLLLDKNLDVTISSTCVEYRRLSEFGCSVIRIKIDCGEPQICFYTESVDLLDNYHLRPSYLSQSEIRIYLEDAQLRISERLTRQASLACAEQPKTVQ